MPKILEATGIWKVFEGSHGPIEVLRGVDLEVVEGEVVVVIGASGAGKSTLLHILGTLDRPDRGALLIKGVDPLRSSSARLNRLRNGCLGFVFQFHYLLPEFTAVENVMMPAVIAGGQRSSAAKKAAELLGEVGLAERLLHRPAELSGGEQQRVAVARALMNDPAIVLADEPSGNLDERASDGLHALMHDLSRSKKQTFIVVTHKKELLAKADRAFVLREGSLHRVDAEGHDLPVL